MREAIELNTDAEEHKIETETNGSPTTHINGDKKGVQSGNKNFEIPQDANIISLDDDWNQNTSKKWTNHVNVESYFISCEYLINQY